MTSRPSRTARRQTLLSAIGRHLRADPAAFAALAAFAVAGVAWLVHPWHPVEDLAITELEVRRVSSSFPLAGAYSSLPFRHPGPALFLWMWPFYELFGRSSPALLAATCWFTGLAVALVLALARRLGGHLLVVVLALGLATWSIGSGRLIFLHPWNPYVGAVPAVALVLLAWAMVERRAWALPIAVAVGSWMVQAHIQFAPLVAVLVGGGAAVLVASVARHRRASELVTLRRATWWAVGVGGVLWAPTIVDVVLHGTESNPADLWRHYRTSDDPTTPARDVVNIARSALSFQPTWAGGPRPYAALLLPIARLTPAMVPFIALAAVGAIVRRSWTEVRGLAVAALALATSIASISRITGPIGDWYLIAVEAASITLAATSVVSLIRWAQATARPRVVRWADGRADVRADGRAGFGQLGPFDRRDLVRWGGATVVLVVVAVALGSLHQREDEQVAASVAAQVQATLEPRIEGRPVLLEARSGLGGWVHSAVALQLERSGHQVFATTTLDDKFPADMEAPAPDDAVRFVFVTDPPPDVTWAAGVEVVVDRTFQLRPGEHVYHLVVLDVPRRTVFVTVEGLQTTTSPP